MTETPITTKEDTGFSFWCNNCNDFPGDVTVTTSKYHMVVECGDCGNSEVYR